jgi:hypothetical protein
MANDAFVREAVSVTKTAVKETENLIKKAWSIMDAASEKAQPSEYLSPKTIQSIQGRQQG